MINTPGINLRYRQYIELIDMALLSSSSKNEPFSGVLKEIQKEFKDIDDGSYKALEEFVSGCQIFKEQQFRVNIADKGKDTENVWLPILVLGKDWVHVVKDIYGFNLPVELKSCDVIKFKPVKKTANLTCSIILRSEINMTGEEFDSIFYPELKKPYNIEIDEYNIDNQKLKLKKLQTIQLTEKHAEDFSIGDISKQLKFLLNRNGIKRIEINYPITIHTVPQLKDIISVLVVIPNYYSNTTNKAWDTALNLLGITEYVPFHVMLSSNSEVFFPFVEKYIDNLLTQNIIYVGDDNLFEEHILLQRFSFLGENILRIDAEYKILKRLFLKIENADTHGLISNSKYNLNFNNIKNELLNKIGNIEIIDSYLKQLILFGRNAQKIIFNETTLKNEDNRESERRSLFRRSDDGPSKTQFNKLLSFLANELIEMIVKNIEIIKAVYKSIWIDTESESKAWNWLYNIENSENINLAIKILVTHLLTSDNKVTRIKSLSGLLYLLSKDDVINDIEPEIGFMDDEYAIAQTLYSIKKTNVVMSENILTWIRQCMSKADTIMGTNTQTNIENRLDSIFNNLKQILELTEKTVKKNMSD